MVRKDLWSDDPESLNRRLAVYATLWYALKTLVLLFNPICPFISENLHHAVYKKLDPTLEGTINLENWPTPDTNLENDELEQEFAILQQTLPIVYSARQKAQLKRRWPLAKVTIVAPKTIQKAIANLENLFLELANIKTVEYADELLEVDPEQWSTDCECETTVFVYKVRDDKLEGEGLMRDLARRVQALRKDLGFSPTDIVDAVYLAELEPRYAELLKPFIAEMEELVRTKKITLHENHEDLEADWHQDKLDKKKLYIAVL
jgi:valyl-tRNA synthetase